MRIQVKEFQPMVVVLYPIVGFAGMLQVDMILKIGKLFDAGIKPLEPLGMFYVALFYTFLLTAFFHIMDGEKAIFKAIATALLSGLCSAIIYCVLTVLLMLVTAPFGITVNAEQGALQAGFAILTLLSGVVTAFAGLYFVESQDLHEFNKGLIYATQIFYVGVGVFVLYKMAALPAPIMGVFKSVVGH